MPDNHEPWTYVSVSINMSMDPERHVLPDWFKSFLADKFKGPQAGMEAVKNGSFLEAMEKLRDEAEGDVQEALDKAVSYLGELQEGDIPEDLISELVSIAEKAVDKNVGGGVDRDKIPAADFAGKNRSFPIVTPQDVADAARSIGRAGADNYSSAELKSRITRIAKRKGPEFVAKLPGAWQEASHGDEEMDADHEKSTEKKKMPPMMQHSAVDFSSLPSDVVVLRESPEILGEAKGAKKGSIVEALVIREGMSANKVFYSREVLEKSIPLLEGKSMYVDHPAEGSQTRSLASKVGWWENVHGMRVQGSGEYAIAADLHLFENSGAGWFRPMILEALEIGKPEAIGISILAAGKTELVRGQQGIYRNVTEIMDYASADAVHEPGAGGRPMRLIESNGGDKDVMDLTNLTMEKLKELRPDLFPTPDPKPEPKDDTSVADARLQKIELAQSKLDLREALDASKLPDKIQDSIRNMFDGKVVERSVIDAKISEYSGVLAEATTPDNFDTRLPFTIPSGVSVGPDPVEQVQAALDDFFGAEVDEKLKGKYQKIHSIREFYIGVTGDREINGFYDPRYSWLREALPSANKVVGGSTVTMANLVGTSMNRALFKMYQDQPRWWEPIVDKVSLNNMKQQDRVRLHNFGSLTERTTDGAEYTELTWNETAENYTPTEYGNLVPVGRRAIINDDLRGIQVIPKLLAASAVLTLNEYVSNLFTQASGNGPNMADGVAVFNAASHQDNRGTAALDRAELLTARKVIMKMLNDASKRIGLVPRYLLVPIDLESTAWELISSVLDPETANNTPNILRDSAMGMRAPIVVPNWTDANNWYVMCDPAQIACIELGFLFGREVPELLSQQDPSSGMVFTNDVMNYKVRWDFGGDILDYRGMYGSVVT